MNAFMQGVAYAVWQREAYSSPQSDTTLSQVIRPMGVNWITLLVTCYQENTRSTQIQCDTDNTPTDASLIHAIQTAHTNGIRVMLKPHVDLSNDPKEERNLAEEPKQRDRIDSYRKELASWRAEHPAPVRVAGMPTPAYAVSENEGRTPRAARPRKKG